MDTESMQRAKKTPAKSGTETEQFRPPRCTPGTMILWYESPTADPLPAICTQENSSNISCSVFHRDVLNLDPRDGVRYIGDPEVFKDSTSEEGFWGPISEHEWPNPHQSRA